MSAAVHLTDDDLETLRAVEETGGVDMAAAGEDADDDCAHLLDMTKAGLLSKSLRGCGRHARWHFAITPAGSALVAEESGS